MVMAYLLYCLTALKVSYKAVKIPPSRIFIIDPRGDVKIAMGQFKSSYIKLTEIVDQLFPPLALQPGEAPQFSNFHYWREPVPEV